MAYIKKKSERKFKITVCNGYKVNGQKRMKAGSYSFLLRCHQKRYRLHPRGSQESGCVPAQYH